MTTTHTTGGGTTSPRRGAAVDVVLRHGALGVALLVGTALLTGCAPEVSTPDVPATAADVALTAPTEAPPPADRLAVVPAAGTVTVLDGPFTDRVLVHDADLGDGAVSARLDVVSDVSEVLALEVDVASYDAQGRLVGHRRVVVDPASTEPFHTNAGVRGYPLEVPTPGGVSATLAIPVLVNE